jgi:hypothetical protein
MVIRDTVESDIPKLKKLMEDLPYEYILPSLDGFITSVTAELDGEVVVTVAARPTVELYFIGDPKWSTPAMRLEVFKAVHREMEKRLSELGYTDGHAWLPPSLAKSFGRRLIKTFRFPNGAPQWVRSTWESFTGFIGGEPHV